MRYLKETDPEIYHLIQEEEKRQAETLMMIPSENLASKAVEEAMGSSLGNKYGEGYPSKRYYQGNKVIDEVESLVIERAKKLYGVEAVNVQPHSGSPANFAVYTALLNPGDTLMGLSLASGGHLTHGAALSASSKYFRSVQYDVDAKGWIDYDNLRKLAKKEKPKIIVASTTGYARILEWEKFASIAEEVGAWLMADISHLSGLIAAGVYPSPVPYVHVITSTTHKTLRGPRGAMIMTTAKGLAKDPEMAKKIDKAIIPGIQGGPHFNNIAGIGVALKEASTKSYKKYAEQVLKNAKVLEEEFKKYNFDLVTGGTDCHLLLIDLRNKNILGNTAAEGCDAANIVLNRNGIPYDPNPPFFPSGIRLGTPGITSRGMKEKEMKQITGFINEVISGLEETKKKLGFTFEQERKRDIRQQIVQNTKIIPQIQKEVKALCKLFPMPDSY
jgi:glycine hydroxymethyltransferase